MALEDIAPMTRRCEVRPGVLAAARERGRVVNFDVCARATEDTIFREVAQVVLADLPNNPLAPRPKVGDARDLTQPITLVVECVDALLASRLPAQTAAVLTVEVVEGLRLVAPIAHLHRVRKNSRTAFDMYPASTSLRPG